MPECETSSQLFRREVLYCEGTHILYQPVHAIAVVQLFVIPLGEERLFSERSESQEPSQAFTEVAKNR